MRLCITARRVGLEDPRRSDLEERLRLLLGSWTCQIREAKVCLEDVNGSKGGLDVRCEIEAALIASGRITVQGLGTDTESAMRAAVRQLLRPVRREFYRKQVGMRIER
jgi:putative sigma-54 modulation protein